MEHAQHRQNLWCPDVIKEVLRTRLASAVVSHLTWDGRATVMYPRTTKRNTV